MSKMYSTPGLFGSIDHYDSSGNKIGESWPGFFGGETLHYDADGGYIGRSEVGILADAVHYDAGGSYIGESQRGFLGVNHYTEDGYAGSSYPSMFGMETDLF